MATKSDWKVTANPVGDSMIYGVYRLLDVSEVDHSGNRELFGDYVDDKATAERLAAELNQKEAADKQTGLEFLKTAPAEEIAEVLASCHPPVGVVHCDSVSCRDCWLYWLQHGRANPRTCPKPEKEARHE